MFRIAAFIMMLISGLILAGCSSPPSGPPTVELTRDAEASAPATFVYSHKIVVPSAECLADIKKAAALAVTDVGQSPAPGDHEMKLSATLCTTVDEWASALDSYPDATGAVRLTNSNLPLELAAICGLLPTGAEATADGLPDGGASAAPLCLDAKALGLDQPASGW
jgi:hypothetical protein